MSMKTIQVGNTTPLQLDWLVAKCRGYREIRIFPPHRPTDRGWIEVRFNPEPKAATARFDPTDNWFLGGPILDRMMRNGLRLGGFKCGYPSDPTSCFANLNGKFAMGGSSALIAGLRCYVASEMGETVEIPSVLWSEPKGESSRAEDSGNIVVSVAHQDGTVATGLISG